MDIGELTAVELCSALRSRQLSSVEVTRHYLARAEHDICGAFVELTPELALARARELDRIPPAGLIHGAPLADKDLQLRAGTRTTHGSRGWAEQPTNSDRLVTALDTAGAVSIGKTATPEFGFAAHTSSLAHGHTTIPGHPELGAGGSSGGAAAAVAAGMLPFAPGSDAGGSVRIPAAACGIVGLKPTRGRVPAQSGLGTLGMLAVPGALARTVADAALLVEAMIAGSPRRLSTLGCPPAQLRVPQRPSRRRVGVLGGFAPWREIVDAPIGAEARGAVEAAAAALAAEGHEVAEVAAPELPGYADAFLTIWQANAAAIPMTPAQHELLEPLTRRLVDRGRELTAGRIVAALRALFAHEEAIVGAFEGLDAVLTPTTALPPRPIDWYPEDPWENFLAQCRYAPHTSFVNVAGLPALSLPTWWRGGLSMSVQLIGRPGGEDALLQLGAELERVCRPGTPPSPPGAL